MNRAVAFARLVGIYLFVGGTVLSFWAAMGIDEDFWSSFYGDGYQERVFLQSLLAWLYRASWVLILAEIVSRLLRRRSSLFRR